MFIERFWLFVLVSFSSGIIMANYFLEKIMGLAFVFFVVCMLFLLIFLLIIKLEENLKRDRLALFFISLFFFFFAFWRYLISWPEINQENISYYKDRELVLIGQVNSDTVFKDEKQKIKIKVEKIKIDDGVYSVCGNVLVLSKGFPSYNYGEFLEVRGTFTEGGIIDGFNYGLYLKKNNISLIAYYPQIKKIENVETEKSFFKKNIFSFKKYLIFIFDFNLSLKSSALAKAIFLGDKSGLDFEQRQNFSKSGLSHIVAISGLHISFLSACLLNFLLAIGFSRNKSFFLIIFFLFVYLFLIGFPASALRAYFMGILSLLALCLGRAKDISRLLFFSGFVLLLINPFLILIDLGFQLSFLAVLGIIYVHPKIKEYLNTFLSKKKLFKKYFKELNILSDVLSVTLSAQITTAPILINSFGQISLVAPLSNLFVLWTLPFIMIFLISASILSFIFPSLSFVFFLPNEILFNYLNFVSDKSLLIPKAFIDLDINSFYFFIIYYFFVFMIFFGQQKNRR